MGKNCKIGHIEVESKHKAAYRYVKMEDGPQYGDIGSSQPKKSDLNGEVRASYQVPGLALAADDHSTPNRVGHAAS